MKTEHPITPPPELVQQWWDGTHGALYEFEAVVIQAARWGADQQLEACTTWLLLNGWGQAINGLRAARRPKPSSLKEQSIALIDKIQYSKEMWQTDDLDVVRRALESLPD
jgi:hypothetical protein